jgi:hypothetical protein
VGIARAMWEVLGIGEVGRSCEKRLLKTNGALTWMPIVRRRAAAYLSRAFQVLASLPLCTAENGVGTSAWGAPRHSAGHVTVKDVSGA